MENTGGAFAINLVQVLLGAIVGGGGVGTIISAITAWRSHRARVEGDERKAKDQLATDLRGENRALADYAHDLRRQVSELGGTPHPWPEELKHL